MKMKAVLTALVLLAATVATSLTFNVVVLPAKSIIHLSHPREVTLSGFCNSSPCNFQWFVVLSNSGVGGLVGNAGPQVVFVPGTVEGRAYVFAKEIFSGTTVQAIVDVVP
jgi:hypothetical protein